MTALVAQLNRDVKRCKRQMDDLQIPREMYLIIVFLAENVHIAFMGRPYDLVFRGRTSQDFRALGPDIETDDEAARFDVLCDADYSKMSTKCQITALDRSKVPWSSYLVSDALALCYFMPYSLFKYAIRFHNRIVRVWFRSPHFTCKSNLLAFSRFMVRWSFSQVVLYHAYIRALRLFPKCIARLILDYSWHNVPDLE
jgi:hypothetical protein